MSPTYREVEEAIAGVPGVAEAHVGAGPGSGRGRLRIRLREDADADAVSRAISDVLYERFEIDIDPAVLRPPVLAEDGPPGAGARTEGPAAGEPPVAERAAAEPAVAERAAAESDVAAESDMAVGAPHPVDVERWTHRRPVIRDLELGSLGLEVHAEAVLDLDGRELRGHARGARTPRWTYRAIARATLDAVELVLRGRARSEVEAIELGDDGEVERVTVTVTFLTDDGAETLVGVSLVRGDPEQAVMRATLDAVNRRVGLLLREQGEQPD